MDLLWISVKCSIVYLSVTRTKDFHMDLGVQEIL